MTASAGDDAVPDRPARLSVGVVGAGRAGAALGAALARAGHHVVAASAVSRQSLARVEAMLPGAAVVTPPEVLAVSDLVLLTVPDDLLAGLVAGLAATDSVRPGQFLVHTSGRYGVGVLDVATQRQALPLALHPVMTFSGTPTDLARLVGATFGVTAPDRLRPAAEALVLEVGAEPVWVAEELRPLWHAALSHGANHLVTLVAQSMDLLRAAGVAEPSRVLAPLLSAALDNVLRSGDAALTGPVARGDAGTVAAHVQALKRVDPEALRTYRSLARATADRALASGRLGAADAEALLDALAGPADEARA
jgi:predicted short-subunit dehydrogenase-like oxidoreductase (DUF2520 family)